MFKYRFGDRVKIVGGFWAGNDGMIEEGFTDGNYTVSFAAKVESDPKNEYWKHQVKTIHETYLEPLK